ncbi:MAG: ABC transporter ATP-binding protein [Dehalococcoidia bacterium]|nr:ABC transporter ATP-binding protein [Dehalococcoidia bacterium]
MIAIEFKTNQEPTGGPEPEGMTRDTDPRNDETPLAELIDVTIKLGDRVVLREVSAKIWPGEFIGLIGSNGAGKTTLLRVLLGLLQTQSGETCFAGERIRRGNPRVGYCPQIRSFDRDLPMTGRDFVGLGIDGHRWGFSWPSRKRRAKIDEVLSSVGATAYAQAPIGRLSGGEQQRLAIAQALISEPSLLLLDEPLASLDMRSQSEIVSLVDRVRRERHVAILFVTHGINPLLGVMDRVWYLAGGRAAIGPVDEIIRADVLSRLYGSPVEVVRVQNRVFVLAGDEEPEIHGREKIDANS